MRKKWIVGVSGGGDSMALLTMCMEHHMDVVVAHMNYQKRSSADRDMEGVQVFCKLHAIPCVVKYQNEVCVGNFQAFAREQRYIFYHELVERYQAYGVLVAHHGDDHIETYLMQKQRRSIPTYYGIQRVITIYQCMVLRPLLEYTKVELLAYCEAHGTPYYHDESNDSDDYTRNHIRHNIVEAMSGLEKQALICEIDEQNKRLGQTQNQIHEFLITWDQHVKSLVQLPLANQILEAWIYGQLHIRISRKEGASILKMLQDTTKHWTRSLDAHHELVYAYGVLSISPKHIATYAYTYDQLCYEVTPYFTMATTGTSTQALTLTPMDFPICIRSPQKGDTIALRFGNKKVNRWFIDRKIPHHEREIWPIVVNAQGKIILVPKIGCDIEHFSNNPNLFVIK